ncbi:prolyl oligopeptidase family serine peptidase [Marinobacter hydrocarbonoclasticus]|nr:prolyl oligopeptidase family serine peptidase [Marinobacter nauticus]
MKYLALISLLMSPVGFASDHYIPLKDSHRNEQYQAVDISSEASWVAFVEFKNGQLKLWVRHITTGQQANVMMLEPNQGNRFDNFEWIDDDTVLVRYVDAHNARLARFNVALGSRGIKADSHILDSVESVVHPLRDDEDHILVMSDRNWAVGSEVYRVNVQQKLQPQFVSSNRVSGDLKHGYYYVANANGEVLLALTNNDVQRLMYRESVNEQWKVGLEYDSSDFYLEPLARIGAHTLAALTNKDSDTLVVREFNMQTQSLGSVVYQQEGFDIVDAQFDENGNLEHVIYLEKGQPKTLYFSGDGTPLTEGGTFSQVSASQDGSAVIQYTESETNPGAFWMLREGERSLLFKRYPSLEPYALRSSEVFSFERDGAEIDAMLTLPAPERSNGVLLVNPHGGPIGVADGLGFNPKVQYYLSRGYAVLRVNYRGSAGKGKAFEQLGVGEQGRGIEADIQAAVSRVKSRIDFDYTCAIGASYGGYSALALTILYPDDYQCAVSGFGLSDLGLLFHQTNYFSAGPGAERVKNTYGDAPDQDLEMRTRSPFYLADQINVPVFLYGGLKDQVVDIEHLHRMALRLKQLDKPHHAVVFRHSGHGHDNWIPEQFELSLVDHFIRSTLQLELPEGEENRGTLGQELFRAGAHLTGLASDDWMASNHILSRQVLAEAVELDYPAAHEWLGNLKEKGLGGSVDKEAAFALYLRGHELGHRNSSFALAKAYYEGNGTEVDREAAKLLLYDLATGQDKAAISARSHLHKWGL